MKTKQIIMVYVNIGDLDFNFKVYWCHYAVYHMTASEHMISRDVYSWTLHSKL